MGDSERKSFLHFVNTKVIGTISGKPTVWLEAGIKWASGDRLVILG